MPGISVFYKDADGTVFHTYSCYSRGIDVMNATYQYLDLVPKGRDEAGLPAHHDVGALSRCLRHLMAGSHGARR